MIRLLEYVCIQTACPWETIDSWNDSLIIILILNTDSKISMSQAIIRLESSTDNFVKIKYKTYLHHYSFHSL